MNAVNAIHPSAETLKAFGLGKLDAFSAEPVKRHLDACAQCKAALAKLVGGADRLNDPQDRKSTVPPQDSALMATQESPLKPEGPARIPAELRDNAQYAIVRELGRGGMGVVFLAQNKMMGRLEVLKVINKTLLDQPSARERFLREIQMAAKLSHENVVRAYSAMQLGDLVVLVMEYVEGQDLHDVVKDDGPLSISHACYYARQVALGLQHALERKMVHRDIKPGNLMLIREGKKHIVKILDFGLAKATSEKKQNVDLTGDGKMLGTLSYMAPEQMRDAANADIRADIFSLGCTLYYLLTGASPYQGNSYFELVVACESANIKPLNSVRPEVPPELSAVVAKMTAKDPSQRYQKPSEVAQALLPFIKSGKSPIPNTPVPVPAVGAAFVETQPHGPVTKPNTPAAFAIPSASAPASSSEHKRTPFWLVAGVGIFFVAALLALALVVRVQTPEGTIVLDNVPADADVLVDGHTVTVTRNGDKVTVNALRAGPHGLKVVRNGVELLTSDVTVKLGNDPVRLRLEPLKEVAANLPAKEVVEKVPPKIEDKEKPHQPEVPPAPKEKKGKAKNKDAGFVPLFNGKDLSGWKTHPKQPGNWRVENGILIGSGPNPSHLFMVRDDYKNFHLRAEARINDGGNSGIFIRSQFGPGFPMGIEAQINSTHSDVNRTGSIYVGHTPTVTVKQMLVPHGEWFTMDIPADGNHTTVIVNGKETASYTDVGKVFVAGHIALQQQNPGTVAEFRKIEIKDLPLRKFSKEVFVPLFNGRDLSGWNTHPKQPGNWRVEKGILVGSGPSSPTHLYTERGDYSDFHLRAEIRYDPVALTGIYFRAGYGPTHPPKTPQWLLGYNAKVDKRRIGGLIVDDGKFAPLIRSFEPQLNSGEWVTLEVFTRGNRITIKVDGKITVDYTDELHSFQRGYIVLQQHSPQTVAEFRKIEIRELPGGD